MSTQVASRRHTREYTVDACGCDARPLASRRAEAVGQRVVGLFVERIFSAHPLAGVTARINFQQKYARYFRWPDENIRARAALRTRAAKRERKHRTRLSGDARRVFCFQIARAPNIRRDESSPAAGLPRDVLFAPRHRGFTNRVTAFTCDRRRQ